MPLFEGTEFQYSSFDFLWWVLIAYFTIRLLKTENPRWWLAIGAAVGVGLLTKYSIVFYIAGILAGVVLTNARRYLLSKWFWAGIGVALLIFLPNFLWLVHHDFISYHFLQHIHARDVGEGRAEGFFQGQLLLNVNTFATPLWIAGLVSVFATAVIACWRGCMWSPWPCSIFGKGRFYYMSAAYPHAAGDGRGGRRTMAGASASDGGGSPSRSCSSLGVAVVGAYVLALIVPFASSGPLRDFTLKQQRRSARGNRLG